MRWWRIQLDHQACPLPCPALLACAHHPKLPLLLHRHRPPFLPLPQVPSLMTLAVLASTTRSFTGAACQPAPPTQEKHAPTRLCPGLDAAICTICAIGGIALWAAGRESLRRLTRERAGVLERLPRGRAGVRLPCVRGKAMSERGGDFSASAQPRSG